MHLFRPASGYESTTIQHRDLVGVQGGGDAMGDNELGPSGTGRIDRGPDLGFGAGIEGGHRLIEDDDVRVGEQDARDGHALPLPSGQPYPALTDAGRKPLGQGGDEPG